MSGKKSDGSIGVRHGRKNSTMLTVFIEIYELTGLYAGEFSLIQGRMTGNLADRIKTAGRKKIRKCIRFAMGNS